MDIKKICHSFVRTFAIISIIGYCAIWLIYNFTGSEKCEPYHLTMISILAVLISTNILADAIIIATCIKRMSKDKK